MMEIIEHSKHAVAVVTSSDVKLQGISPGLIRPIGSALSPTISASSIRSSLEVLDFFK